jgi:DNA-binding NtrC family response regulator
MHRILVVDDEKVIRDGCARLLSAEGYQVVIAANGREALDLLAAEPVDLILCDLIMPVMGASEVLDNVKTLCPGIPLVIITGHGTVANAVECMKKGACDFITKPFRAEQLLTSIRTMIEKSGSHRES